MKQKFLLVAFILICISEVSFGQKLIVKRADKRYAKEAYSDAVILYEKAIKRTDTALHVVARLADTQRKLSNWKEAEKWYKYLFEKGSPTTSELYYYAEALKVNEKYKEAGEIILKYYDAVNNDSRAAKLVSNPNYVDKILSDSIRYIVKRMGISSEFSDFAPAFYGNVIVFASARDEGLLKPKYKWKGEPYLDLYKAEKSKTGSLQNVSEFSADLNSDYHEGTLVFTRDWNQVYFTRNNYIFKSTDQNRVNRLKILHADWNGEKWQNITEMPWNSEDYSTGHPTLTPDGTKMYFSSDMPGGYGGTDIYESSLSNGEWSKPRNLGNVINSEGNEMFPFMHIDGTLYFASDGHPGLGGLDLFYSKPGFGGFNPPQNMGFRANSSKDDFSLILDDNKLYGYFSSNRQASTGDDLYHITVIPYPPVANRDSVTIAKNSKNVKLFPIENDKPGDCPVFNVSAVSKQTARGGTAILNLEDNTVSYTPANNYIGIDSIAYTICDTLTTVQGCSSSYIIINIKQKTFLFEGLVIRKKNKAPIDSVLVSMENLNTNKKYKTYSNKKGEFKFVLDIGERYAFRYDKVDFHPELDSLDTRKLEKDTIRIKQELKMLPYRLEGICVYRGTREPVPNVHVILHDSENPEIDKRITDANGKFSFPLLEDYDYNVRLVKDELLVRTAFVSTKNMRPGVIKMEQLFEMDKLKLGTTIEISILFDLGKDNIRPDAAQTLDREAVQLFKDNPDVRFEFGAHTDSRGSAASNLDLSQRRATSSVNYITAKGISKDQIQGVGYGESKLKNKCADGVSCSEALHQQNRRMEIKIVAIKAK